jgi:hypothetical protein
VQDQNDVETWNLFLFFPSGAFFCLFEGGMLGIRKLRVSHDSFFLEMGRTSS